MNYAAPAGQTTIDIESGTFEIVTKEKLSIKPQLSVKQERRHLPPALTRRIQLFLTRALYCNRKGKHSSDGKINTCR